MQKKTILITGASSGIGEALAIEYANPNIQLVLAARRVSALEKVKEICEKKGAAVVVIVADMSKQEAVENLAKKAHEAFGSIHILINNAGISQRSTIEETIFEVDRNVMELNYFSQIYLTKLLLPELKKNQGSIAVLSSLSGLFGFPLRSAYSASKHALHGFFETMQLEEPLLSITLVCPGRIRTDISLSAITSDGSKHGVMDDAQLNGIPADVCAKKIIRAIHNRKKLMVIAQKEHILLFFYRYMRPLFYIVARRIKPN